MKRILFVLLTVFGCQLISSFFGLAPTSVSSSLIELSFAPLLIGNMVVTDIDWKKFGKNRSNPAYVKELVKQITMFFQSPVEIAKQLAKVGMKANVGVDSNLVGTPPIISVFNDVDEADFGYERLFKPVDMRGTGQDSFEILDTTNGVTFEQLAEGEPIKLRKVSTAKTAVKYLRFGAGLGFLDTFFEFNKHYLLDDIVTEVRTKYYSKKSKLYYDLLTVLGSGINEAFATDDVTTINNAAASILKNIAGKGYAAGENPVFKLACGVGLKARLSKALAAAFTNPNGNNNQIVYRIDEVVASSQLSDSNWYLILPGIKMQRGDWKDLNAESSRDNLRRAEDITWEGMYNGAIGDSTQVRRGSLV